MIIKYWDFFKKRLSTWEKLRNRNRSSTNTAGDIQGEKEKHNSSTEDEGGKEEEEYDISTYSKADDDDT